MVAGGTGVVREGERQDLNAEAGNIPAACEQVEFARGAFLSAQSPSLQKGGRKCRMSCFPAFSLGFLFDLVKSRPWPCPLCIGRCAERET